MSAFSDYLLFLLPAWYITVWSFSAFLKDYDHDVQILAGGKTKGGRV